MRIRLRLTAPLCALTLGIVFSAVGAKAQASASRAPVVEPAPLPTNACFVVPGAYLRSDVTDVTNDPTDEIVLKSDGTAYFYQGWAVALIQSQGTSVPGIGAWACGPDDTVVVTTVTYDANTGNSDLSEARRFTYQMKFDRNDPDHPVVVQRVVINFDFPASLPTGNILDPNGGTVISTPLTAPRQFARVKALVSDLSR